MLLSICPFLKGVGGHDIPYQQSLQSALRGNLQVRVLGTTVAKNIILPEDFLPVLPVYRSSMSIEYWVNYVSAIRKELRKPIMSSGFLFIESFGLGHLLGLAIAIMLSTAKIDGLIILIRSNLILDKFYKEVTLKGVLLLYQKFLKLKIVFTSDSELVSIFLNKKFKVRAVVLPIPHADVIVTKQLDQMSKSYGSMVCWMPGSSRPEKKYDVAAKLFIKSAKLNHHTLWMPGSLKHLLPLQDSHIFFEKPLTDNEYQNNLMGCDVVLLPYDPRIYEMATSGIFVECIIAGKYPITSQGSWMSHELSKYGLQKLGINWEAKNSESELNKALMMLYEKKYLDRLKKMREDYIKFHNKTVFAKIFISLLQT